MEREIGMGIGTRTNKGNPYSKLARIDKSVLNHRGSKACQSKLKNGNINNYNIYLYMYIQE